MDCGQHLPKLETQSPLPPLVPAVYKAPYFSKGYQPFPAAPKPPTLPIKLKEYLEEERRASLTPEEKAQLLEKLKVHPTWPDFKTLFNQFQCPEFIPRGESAAADESKLSKPKQRRPSGVSRAYWKLQTEKYGQPPTASKFRRERFSIDEIKQPKKFVPFPLYESPSNVLPSEYVFKPNKQKRKISYHTKIMQMKNYQKNLKNQLEDWRLQFSKNDNVDPAQPMIPENRLNHGCEKIRALCDIAPPVIYTIVKKFVTGPPNKDLFWLSRTEAMECWGRIVEPGGAPKKCCVQAPIYQYPKMKIDSLKRPPSKPRKHIPEETPVALGPCIKKSKGMKKLRPPATSLPPIAMKDSSLPPFCDPIPPPELRLPWHIPPLKPKDGNDRRKKFVVDRQIDLDDIIPYKKDRYGTDRRKQKWIRDRIMREAMTEEFFNRTDVTTYLNEVDMIMKVGSIRKLGQGKKHALLAQSLKRGERETTAAEMRQKEAELEKERRHELRNRIPDYSHVKSKYLDRHNRFRRYSFL